MANRPKRKKKPTSQPNIFTEASDEVDSDSTENPDPENKSYRNQPKKRKPFVNRISIRNYKPKNKDRYFH